MHVNCPECHGVFNVKAFRVGHRVQCKLCGSVVRVPMGDASPSEPVSHAVDEPTPQPRPLLRRRAFDAMDSVVEPADAPRRPGQRRSVPSKQPMFIVGGIVLVVLVVVMAVLAGGGSSPVVSPAATPTTPVPAVAPVTGDSPR